MPSLVIMYGLDLLILLLAIAGALVAPAAWLVREEAGS